jgi:hypothetical protein
MPVNLPISTPRRPEHIGIAAIIIAWSCEEYSLFGCSLCLDHVKFARTGLTRKSISVDAGMSGGSGQ